MKNRTYYGNIANKEDREKYNLPLFAHFTINGFWYAGSKTISSYVITDENGNEIEKYSRFQFSRTRDNIFYLESI